MFNGMKHSILSTRRWRFSLSILYPFNVQTTRWNVGWGGFVYWAMRPERLTSIMSSWFIILYVVLWLLSCPKSFSKFPCATACFLVILMFLSTRFRVPMRKYMHNCSIDPNYDVCKSSSSTYCYISMTRSLGTKWA